MAGGTRPLAIRLLSSFPQACPLSPGLGDLSPRGQLTHLVHPWALAVRHAHPSLGFQAGPASRGSRSIACWPGSQVAVPAGAAAALVQGGTRSWGPCPSWGRSWTGDLGWPTQPRTHPPHPLTPQGSSLSTLRSPSHFPRPLIPWAPRIHGQWGHISELRPPASWGWGPSLLSQIRLCLGPCLRKVVEKITTICPYLGVGGSWSGY